MRYGRSLGAASLLAVSVAGCVGEDTLAPGKKIPVVHAVLDLGASSQVILVGYSDVTGRGGPISGALVTITTPDGIVMTATPDTVVRKTVNPVTLVSTTRNDTVDYRITPSAYGVTLVGGATYTLRVHTPAGEDVVGTTTVPLAAAVAIDTVASPFVRLRDTLTASLANVVGAAAYEFRTTVVASKVGAVAYAAFVTNQVSVAGTTRALSSGDEVFRATARLAVLISAVDSNYYQYYRIISDPFVGAAPSHLTGAVGVFGSLVPMVSKRLDIK